MNNTQKHTLKGLGAEDIFNIINADDNLDQIQAIVTACNAHADLVETLKTVREDFEMLKNGEWDGSKEGCEDSINLIDQALNKIK